MTKNEVTGEAAWNNSILHCFNLLKQSRNNVQKYVLLLSHTCIQSTFSHTVVVSVYVHTFIKEVDRFLIVDSFLIELLFEDGITQISG